MRRYVFVFIVAICAMLFGWQVASGETVKTRTFIKGDKIIVCECPLEYPKPAESLGIPDEVAVEVVSQGESQGFKMGLRKVNFFSAPFVLEIEEVIKMASYNLTQGWLVKELEIPKISQQKLWRMTVSVAITFFGLLVLVYLDKHRRFSLSASVDDFILMALSIIVIFGGVVITGVLFIRTRAELQVLGYPLLLTIMVSIAILYGFALSLRRKRKNKTKKPRGSLSL